MKLKVLYRVYDYKSNPKLNDTDFDGLWDNTDSKPIDNKFKGTSADIGKVEYNNDFRWFFTKNSKYNDELAVMSLIASNLANGKTISTDQVSGNITQYLEKIGFTDVRCLSDNGSVYMGKKTITYYGITKNIYAVILGGGETEQNYKAILDYVNDENPKTIKTLFIRNTKIAMQDVAQGIADNAYFSNMNNTFWVTGYGVAGSMAAEVAAKLTDKGGEVYAYTFGATNTGVGTKGGYLNIKNVINEDDYIPKVVNPNVYQRPGQTYSSSIKEDLLREYRDIVGNTNYKGDYYLSNFISKIFEERKNGISTEMYEKLAREWSRHLEHYSNISFELQTNGETSDVALAINNISKATKDAHSIKSYYVLAKSLNGFDLTDGNGEKIIRYQYIPGAMLVSFNQTETVTEEIDTSFADALRMKIVSIENFIDDNKKMNNQENRPEGKDNWCYKLIDNNVDSNRITSNELDEDDYVLKYSNYTLPDNIKYYDISYSQFWDDEEKKELIANSDKVGLKTNSSHYILYKNNAGDFSTGDTKMVFGRYHKGTKFEEGKLKKTDRTIKVESYGKGIYVLYDNNGYKCELYTIDGRIIAAMPLHLLLGLVNGVKDEGYMNDLYINYMDKKTNYGHNLEVGKDEKGEIKYEMIYDGTGKYNEKTKVSDIAYNNRQYNYVDVVMESKYGYQYVIPFMAVDSKWLDSNPYANSNEKHYPALTDNTYGHVFENVATYDVYGKEIDIEEHNYSYMNPIEPYIKVTYKGEYILTNSLDEFIVNNKDEGTNGDLCSDVNQTLQDLLFGNDKIVSMRLYGERYSNKDWWVDIRDKMQAYDADVYADESKKDKSYIYKGEIVRYNTKENK